MNEPIETAAEVTGTVTVGQLRKALKGFEISSLHGEATHGRASYSDSFTFELRAKSAKGKGELSVKIPGYVTNNIEGKRANRAFWFLRYCGRLEDALALLPKNAEIALKIYQDGGTSKALQNTQNHSDWLLLLVKLPGNPNVREILIDTYCGDDNLARPCK